MSAHSSTRPLSSSFTFSTTSRSRPATRHSRPATGRPATAVSSRNDVNKYVVAVLEGRGIGREVGIAALDKDTGQVDIVQVRAL